MNVPDFFAFSQIRLEFWPAAGYYIHKYKME